MDQEWEKVRVRAVKARAKGSNLWKIGSFDHIHLSKNKQSFQIRNSIYAGLVSNGERPG